MVLNSRQKEILQLMCKDYNQKNIASVFKCSLSLVEKEVKTLKDLFKVETNSGLIYKYLTRNVTDKFVKECLF